MYNKVSHFNFTTIRTSLKIKKTTKKKFLKYKNDLFIDTKTFKLKKC